MSRQVPFSVAEWQLVKLSSRHLGYGLVQEKLQSGEIKFPRFAYFTDDELFLYFMIGFHVTGFYKQTGWRICRINVTTNTFEYRSILYAIEQARVILKRRLMKYNSPMFQNDGWE